MGFATTSDLLLRYALSSGLGALTAASVFLLAVIAARLRLLHRAAAEARIAQRWNPLIAQCAESVPSTLPPLEARELEGFLLLWCRALETLRGRAEDNLRELARRLGIEPRVEKLLLSRSLPRLLLALVSVGHLRSRGAIPRLLDLLRDAPPVLSLNAARALMRIDPGVAMPHVLEATARREDWAAADIVPAFMDCDPAQVGTVLAAAISTELYKESHGVRTGGVARLIKLHVAAQGVALHGALIEVLGTAKGTSALFGALSALSAPEDAAHARRFLAHREWPLRAAAARALGRLGTQDDFAPLSERLADSSFWVRYRAAQALCALPGIDLAWLQALAGRLTDRFSRDMLRQAMAEKGMA